MCKKGWWTWRQNNRDYVNGNTERENAGRKWTISETIVLCYNIKESSVCITWVPGGDNSKTIFTEIMIEKNLMMWER